MLIQSYNIREKNHFSFELKFSLQIEIHAKAVISSFQI